MPVQTVDATPTDYLEGAALPLDNRSLPLGAIRPKQGSVLLNYARRRYNRLKSLNLGARAGVASTY